MPWWGWVSISVAAVLVLLLLVSRRLFLVACVPRGSFDEDAHFEMVAKKSDAVQAVQLREAFDAYVAAPGEEVFVRSFDGLRLRGHFVPAEAASGKVLLLCHGWNSSAAADFAAAVPFLHDLGWSLLLIDQRAQNGSEGRYMTFGALEHRDVRCWVDYLCQRLGPDCRIVLDGISMGAATVMLALGDPQPPQLKGGIADCGFDSAVSEFRYLARRHHLPLHLMLPLTNLWARVLGGFSFYDTDAAAALARTPLPVMLAHGTGDDFVPCDCTRRLAAQGGDKTVLLVEGAAHGFSYVRDTPRYQAAVRDFLARMERA